MRRATTGATAARRGVDLWLTVGGMKIDGDVRSRFNGQEMMNNSVVSKVKCVVCSEAFMNRQQTNEKETSRESFKGSLQQLQRLSASLRKINQYLAQQSGVCDCRLVLSGTVSASRV